MGGDQRFEVAGEAAGLLEGMGFVAVARKREQVVALEFWRVVPELRIRGISIYREVQRPPYRIVYRTVGAEVWVLAIVDGRRDLDGLLFDRARR